MTEPRQNAARQRRAKRTMVAVTCACILLASTPAIVRLAGAGWGAFVNRPPGVGATASSPADAAPADPVGGDTTTTGPQTAPQPAALVPMPPPAPDPAPRPRPRRPSQRRAPPRRAFAR